MPTSNVHLKRAEVLIEEAGRLLHERRPMLESAALLSESAPFPAWAVDRLGALLWCNPEFEAVVHASVHELRGRSLTAALGPSEAGLSERDDEVVATARSRRYETTIHDDGVTRHILKWPLYADDGAVIGVCGAMA